MLWLFILTVFTCASLVFSIQPIYARLLLPLLGGSPAVWNTVVTFFQAVLLLGYGYAHLLTKKAPLRWQFVIHVVVLSVPMLLLPVALPAGLEVPPTAQPHLWIYWLMMVTVGAPFFALSTTAPLMQKWFSWSGHKQSGNPYFLYVASNTGSLLALLSYPILIEPVLGLREQAAVWRYGYMLLVALMFACALYLWCKATGMQNIASSANKRDARAIEETISWSLRLRWLLLAFIPSSLMLGVTTFISSEVAAIPLMWIVPLALYLLTYILAFAQRQLLGVGILKRIQILLTLAVVMLIDMQATQPLLPLMLVHLLYFFITAWLCHALLSSIKPSPANLTEFYLWLCVGGVMGGLFNSLVAPLLFSSILEYPLVVVATVFVTGWFDTKGRVQINLRDFLLPLALFVGLVAISYQSFSDAEEGAQLYGVIFGLPIIICYFLTKRALRYALGILAVLLGGMFFEIQPGRELFAGRSYFGVSRVTQDARGFHRLFHGKTIHGMQNLEAGRKREPLTYYHPTGPIGDVFAYFSKAHPLRVSLVGMGAGALACYARPGEDWTFYEIDPLVDRIAHDTRYFSYLADAATPIKVKLGDARLNLTKESGVGNDIIVLDAYSSDSIPIHLVTREAMALYLERLAPGGLIAAHISNQHLDLAPVFASLAADLGLVALYCDDTAVGHEAYEQGKSPSQWMVLARGIGDIKPLLAGNRWRVFQQDLLKKQKVWTDDYSSIWSVFSGF